MLENKLDKLDFVKYKKPRIKNSYFKSLENKNIHYNTQVNHLQVKNNRQVHDPSDDNTNRWLINLEKKQKIDLHNTKQFIKNHKILRITKADKGNATVVIEKTVYLDKMNTLLQDERYYNKLKGDPLLSLEKESANYIKQLNSKNFMGDDTKIQHKIAQKCNTSKAYGLIKIHKQGFPVRPIISTINSPTYNLPKLFSQFLQSKLKKPKSHIDNSLELKLKIEKMKIPHGFEVISLDVVSLFTNVSNELIYAAIEKRWPYLYHYINMSCSEFIDVMKFILTHTHFQFNNVF